MYSEFCPSVLYRKCVTIMQKNQRNLIESFHYIELDYNKSWLYFFFFLFSCPRFPFKSTVTPSVFPYIPYKEIGRAFCFCFHQLSRSHELFPSPSSGWGGREVTCHGREGEKKRLFVLNPCETDPHAYYYFLFGKENIIFFVTPSFKDEEGISH